MAMNNRNEAVTKKKFKELIHRNISSDIDDFKNELFSNYDFCDTNAERNTFIREKLTNKSYLLMIDDSSTPNKLHIIARTNPGFNVLHQLMVNFLEMSPSLNAKHDLKSFENIPSYRNFCTTIPLDKHNLDTLIHLFNDKEDEELRSTFQELKQTIEQKEENNIRKNKVKVQLQDRISAVRISTKSKKIILKDLENKQCDIGFVMPDSKIKNNKTEQYQCADMSKMLMIFPKNDVEDLNNLLATLGSTNAVNVIKEIGNGNCIIDISIAVKYESGKRGVAFWVENFAKLSDSMESPFMTYVKQQIDLINKQRDEYYASVSAEKEKLFAEIFPKDERNHSKIILSMISNFNSRFGIQQDLSLPYAQCRERFILGDEQTIFIKSELTKLTGIDFQSISIEWEPERIFQATGFYPPTSNHQQLENQSLKEVKLCPGWEHGITVEPINSKLLDFYTVYEGRDTKLANGFIVIPFENLALFYVMEYALKNIDNPAVHDNALKTAANLIRQYNFNMIVPEKYQQLLYKHNLLTDLEMEKIQSHFHSEYGYQVSIASEYKEESDKKYNNDFLDVTDVIDVIEIKEKESESTYQSGLTLYQPASPKKDKNTDLTLPSPEKKA